MLPENESHKKEKPAIRLISDTYSASWGKRSISTAKR